MISITPLFDATKVNLSPKRTEHLKSKNIYGGKPRQWGPHSVISPGMGPPADHNLHARAEKESKQAWKEQERDRIHGTRRNLRTFNKLDSHKYYSPNL